MTDDLPADRRPRRARRARGAWGLLALLPACSLSHPALAIDAVTPDVAQDLGDVTQDVDAAPDVPDGEPDVPDGEPDVPDGESDVPDATTDVPDAVTDVPDAVTDVQDATTDVQDGATDVQDATTDVQDALADAPDAADAARDVPDAGGFRTVPDDTRATDWRGQDTGRAPVTLRCEPGEALVGLRGRADSFFVSALGVRCARLLHDGAWGATRASDRIGGDTGGSFDDLCPPAEVIVRFAGRAGAVIDRLRAVCAPVPTWLDARRVGVALPEYGGIGGFGFEDTCPNGYIANGIEIRTGDYLFAERVRRFRMLCVRLAR